MKDLIWTIIIVWLIYKVIGAFQSYRASAGNTKTSVHPGQDKFQGKTTVQEKSRDDGEYVDFEEVK